MTMSKTMKAYRVTVKGSEDTIVVEVKRFSAYMARKYAVNKYIEHNLLRYNYFQEPITIDSAEVELLPFLY